MEKLFPRIETIDDVMRLARAGGVAGLVFAGLILLGALRSAFLGDPIGSGYLSVRQETLLATETGLEIGAILFLTWRVWSGKGYVSAIALSLMFVAEAMSEIGGGLYGAGWVCAYFGAGLMMLNAIRACLRHAALSAAPAAPRPRGPFPGMN